eukprot:TRINITY_DN6485_c0_g1_i1.p1 TRINITY_DN6485_c0_g1~~TRINITY_DN6485_c0_g1_i1.p1  ORF type:complete len:520 (-),score=154.16 TRINITY_DN6485_c0_g1_i1:226-1551(-)
MTTTLRSPPSPEMNPSSAMFGMANDALKLKKRITVEEFRARVASGRNMVVYEGVAYDITNFEHPGGNVLENFAGMDITHHFRSAHWYNQSVIDVMERYRKGVLVGSIQSKEDEDLLNIAKKLEKEGMFDYTWSHIAIDFGEMIGLAVFTLLFFLISWTASSNSFFWLAIATFCLLDVRVFWWMHDTSHHATIPYNHALARKVLNGMVFTFGGISYPTYHHIHHVITNVLEHDSALDTGPIIFHPKMQERAWRWTLDFQRIVWLGGIIPLVYFFAFIPDSVEGWVKKKQYSYLGLGVVRMAVLIYFFGWAFTLIPPAFACATFAFVAGLNHFHMPMSEKVEPSFAKAMTAVTQNTESAYMWTWFSGHLDYHIEHHLFPTMPRHHLPKVKGLVMDFCRRHNLQYHSCSLTETISQFLFQLRNPLQTDHMEEIRAREPLGAKQE